MLKCYHAPFQMIQPRNFAYIRLFTKGAISNRHSSILQKNNFFCRFALKISIEFCFNFTLQVQSSLKHLDLHGNRISTISDSQLNQIQSLVLLNLADNQINIIDDQAFCCLPNLSSLDLSFNPLKRQELLYLH